ncbi:hypothetical protein GH714_009358 [Hevea brasiliensis]|uniref:Glycosyltransferase family 92 protein n=1 Tax=Hevea brasiliensis TaxID=3981 RepID=A0A6A6LYB4_HEVBR|nr:hypothetical protein GH714_009358 [Hevea brasiliensis]
MNSATISIRETVILPDQVLIFLKYPQSARLFTKEDLDCVYFAAGKSSSSSQPQFKQPPNQIDGADLDDQIGLNLRPDRLYNTARFECVYGWDLRRPKFLLRSNVISIAQEIVRCRTPFSILNNPQKVNNSIKVSVRLKGRGTLHSIARPALQLNRDSDPTARKPYEMCICTMLRNQARFLGEWVMYHAQIGVQRWFIYDNNSEDNIDSVIASYVNADRGVLVINHYKYQVWEVFKEKFYRRVATYVADWQDEQNVGSKDRVPGLGTRAVEPPDWASRFCEVTDTGLRDRVLGNFRNPITKLLPWQEDGGILDVQNMGLSRL